MNTFGLSLSGTSRFLLESDTPAAAADFDFTHWAHSEISSH